MEQNGEFYLTSQHLVSMYLTLLLAVAELVVVTIVVEVVVQAHYAQTGTVKIKVEANHQVLQKALVKT